ncbi:MAG: DUF2279 domain-containing protein, partial [Chitinophagaceae bacterium]
MNRALKLLSSSWASHSCTVVIKWSLVLVICCTPTLSMAQADTTINGILFRAYPATTGLYNPPPASVPLAIRNEPIVAKLGHLHFTPPADSLNNKQIKKRVKIIAAANLVGYGAVMAGLYQTWYKNYPQSKFHTFNDIGEWQQMDKLGHVYSAYAAGKASMELWRWTGIDRKKRIWIGGMSGAVWQTTIEVLDGFSSEWGWSWGDFAANVAGSGLLVAQELAWDRQRIQMKW